jgi:iduronate 2-sulfatase
MTATIAIEHMRNLSANSKVEMNGNETTTTRPWFLAVGLHKPHPFWPLPLSARQQYEDLPLPTHRYAPEGMPAVAFVSCDYLQMATDVKAEVDAGGGILPNTTLSDGLSRKIRSGYAAGVTWMDQQVGRVLDELDALGHHDDTIVLFTADHGWGLGEHGMWCKYTIFENQARVPMLVRVPWLAAGHGKTTAALVELVDIFPTLADLAGILPRVEATEALDGKSFISVLSDPTSVHKPAAFSQYPRCMNSSLAKEPPYTANRDVCAGHPASEFTHMGLSIRTDEYRYSEWYNWDGSTCSPAWEELTAGAELYSHVGDTTPGCFDCFENVNLVGVAGKEKFATLVASLHGARLFDRDLHSRMPLVPHACSLQASRRVTNGIPLGWPLSYRFAL